MLRKIVKSQAFRLLTAGNEPIACIARTYVSCTGGASRNAIIFRTSDAMTPFATRNAELLDLLAPQFDEQLRQYNGEDGFIELARRTIQDRLTGHRPSIDAVSQALHMSPRTLQRRLQNSGSSFQRVLDNARHQMARYYLSNSALGWDLKIQTPSGVHSAIGKICLLVTGGKYTDQPK